MRYMLDTNIIIYLINKRSENALRVFFSHSPEEICISAITLAELEYGVCNSSKPEQNRLALLNFLSAITVLPFDSKASVEYGIIWHELQRQGTPIGNNDLLIASHARSLDLTLITNNTKEFGRVPDLNVSDWSVH